jgi:hypothetical protein
MWDRNKKRQNTEDKYHQPDYKQYLHESLRPTGVGCIQGRIGCSELQSETLGELD